MEAFDSFLGSSYMLSYETEYTANFGPRMPNSSSVTAKYHSALFTEFHPTRDNNNYKAQAKMQRKQRKLNESREQKHSRSLTNLDLLNNYVPSQDENVYNYFKKPLIGLYDLSSINEEYKDSRRLRSNWDIPFPDNDVKKMVNHKISVYQNDFCKGYRQL